MQTSRNKQSKVNLLGTVHQKKKETNIFDKVNKLSFSQAIKRNFFAEKQYLNIQNNLYNKLIQQKCPIYSQTPRSEPKKEFINIDRSNKAKDYKPIPISLKFRQSKMSLRDLKIQ